MSRGPSGKDRALFFPSLLARATRCAPCTGHLTDRPPVSVSHDHHEQVNSTATLLARAWLHPSPPIPCQPRCPSLRRCRLHAPTRYETKGERFRTHPFPTHGTVTPRPSYPNALPILVDLAIRALSLPPLFPRVSVLVPWHRVREPSVEEDPATIMSCRVNTLLFLVMEYAA